MAIDDKPTPAWDESDLQELCDEQRREQPNLEFKQELPLDRPSEKADVEHDVQGLANSGGGHIIYGIKEGDAGDGSKVAVGLLPLADGGLYDRLNNLLDGRGDPKVPFEIYAIPAAAGGIYLVVHVHGYRGPHMANDNRFYIRRNLLVRPMTAAEVEDGYKQKVVRERSIFGGGEQEPAGGEVEPRIKQGLDDLELAAYRQETGDDMPPGWLSVWTHPEPPVPDLLDPRDHDVYEFRRLQVAELWRGNPLDYLSIAKTNSGFVGRLPPGSDG